MRFLVPAVLMLLSACTQAQAGCNVENCKALLDACRVEFQGEPHEVATCTGFDRPPSPPDWSKYCVDACNSHPGNGQLAECLAKRADVCRDAGVAKLSQAIQPCLDVQPASKGPTKACDDKCLADQVACDQKCSGGKACDTCLRMGGQCANVCTDAGWSACLDCSAKCALTYVACSDFCPREQ